MSLLKGKINKLLLALLNVIFFTSCKQEHEKTNVLFILVDDLGYGQFGVHNDTISPGDFDPFFGKLVDSLEGYSHQKAIAFSKQAIPTIGKLAREGVMFTQAYAPSSLSSPSRIALATGMHQVKWGVYRNRDEDYLGMDSAYHLANEFKAMDYKTAHIGKWHIGRHDSSIIEGVKDHLGLEKIVTLQEINQNCPEAKKELRNRGFRGSCIEAHHPLNHGFDYYYGYNTWGSQYYNSTLVWENYEHQGVQREYNTDTFTKKAIDFMSDQIKKDSSFFVQLHLHAVHDSVEPKAPDKYFNQFDSDSYMLNNFYAHVYGIDCNVKRIVDFLKENGQYENTMIIFASDNGAMSGGSYNGDKSGSPLPGNTPFAGHKGTYYMGGFRVPMFIHWPKGIKKPAVIPQMVSTMDIMPTAIEAIGGKVPEDLDGKSLYPILQGDTTKEIHDYLYWAGMHSASWGYLIMKTNKTHHTINPYAPPAWAIKKGDYLMRYVGTLDSNVYLDYMNGREPVFELYNIATDPGEQNNIINELPQKAHELAEIYFNESKKFPPPVNWGMYRYKDLMQSEKLFYQWYK